MAASFTLNPKAQTGFQNASAYDTHRPSYPPEAVDKLLTYLGVKNINKAQIIDIGSGTGKFTELLVGRDEAYEIVAVEPHVGMREVLASKRLGGRVQVVDGDAGSIPLEDGWGDAVVAAQAFHWFANENSLKEIHRVLKPGATFGMVWNIDDYNGARDWAPSTRLDQVLKDIVISTEDDHPRFRHMKWKEVFDRQQDTTPLQTFRNTSRENFSSFTLPLGEETMEWTIWLSEEAIWSRFSTLSQIVNLDEERREKVHQDILTALREDGVERNEKGDVALHGVTYLAWISRV